MHGFSENQLLGAFLAIAMVLLVTRGMAEVCRKLGQPEVLGELLGGFLIGPSVLGALFPEAFHALFLNPAVSLALQLLSWIGAILLLMIAGMERISRFCGRRLYQACSRRPERLAPRSAWEPYWGRACFTWTAPTRSFWGWCSPSRP